MKLLTFLSYQAFVIALLCSSAFTEKRVATLDELIKTLGSLYQHQLFSVRDEADEIDNLGGRIVGGKPVKPTPELRETVTVPRYHYCMKSIPYCVTFYGSVIVQDKPLQMSEPVKKNIRNTQDQLCLTNIQLGSCSDAGLENDYDEIVDVGNLKIPDFCFPGMIELEGQLEFLHRITENASVHVQMNPTNLPKRSNKNYEPAACSQIGYFYNLCDLLERICPTPWNGHDSNPLPCTCDIEPGVYDAHGFEKLVNKVDFFGLGERSGFAVVSSDEGKSCFTFHFTGTAKSF